MEMQAGIPAAPGFRGRALPPSAGEQPLLMQPQERGHPERDIQTSSSRAAGVAQRPLAVQHGTWTPLPTMPSSSWIADALTELTEVDDEFAEEHFPAIHSTVKCETERILKYLAWYPLAPAVYPTRDAEIAIHFQSADLPGSVLILLNNDGQVDCYAHIRGRNRRAHYDAARDIPDDFLREQLRALTIRRPTAKHREQGEWNP